eukprot:8341877-Heterocapsa_arctica.AAC.1
MLDLLGRCAGSLCHVYCFLPSEFIAAFTYASSLVNFIVQRIMSYASVAILVCSSRGSPAASPAAAGSHASATGGLQGRAHALRAMRRRMR